jgi:hypothetical protein
MRLHGLLVYASFIGFWVAIIPSPSYAQSLAERYESTRRTDFHTAITQALVANNVRGCGEYKYRESRTDEGEYLVYCTQDGKTWTAYLVWASIKKIMGPYPPDPSIK